MSLRITGLGKGVPKRSVSNDELAAFLDTGDDWIYSRTGIRSRHVCTDETLTDLCVDAAQQAMQNARLSSADIDMIICSTIGGDYRTPSLACCVAERIGTICPAFDINAACTGLIYALSIASGFLAAKTARNILIVCAELMSARINWNDRNTCVLFGDGASACIVADGSALKYINLTAAIPNVSVLNLPVGTGNNPFAINKKEDGFLHMQGQEVFKFAVGIVEADLKKALEATKMTLEQIDFFVLHQANKRIIHSIKTKLRQPDEKFPVNIEQYGNLSSVSIPLLLLDMQEDGRLQPGVTLFMSAFGAGLTAGSCVMEWE